MRQTQCRKLKIKIQLMSRMGYGCGHSVMFNNFWKTTEIDYEMERLNETNKFEFDSFELLNKRRFVIIDKSIPRNLEERGNRE